LRGPAEQCHAQLPGRRDRLHHLHPDPGPGLRPAQRTHRGIAGPGPFHPPTQLPQRPMSRPDMKTHITPKQAAALFIPFMILLLLASCNRTPVAAEEAATENAHGPEVELTPEQAKAIALSTGPLEHRDLRSTLKVNGRLTLPPQNEAQVSALIGGIVS